MPKSFLVKFGTFPLTCKKNRSVVKFLTIHSFKLLKKNDDLLPKKKENEYP